MKNKSIIYKVDCGDHILEFTNEELKKWHEALYFTSSVRCYNKDGKLIEDPFEEMPHSYVINYWGHCDLFLDEMEVTYQMPFPAYGNKERTNSILGRPDNEVFTFNNKPYSDGVLIYPGRYEFSGKAEEELHF